MAPYVGYQAKLGMGATSTINEGYEFASENLALDEVIYDPSGIVGHRDHLAARTRTGVRRVQGMIEFQPGRTYMDALLPRMIGGTKSGTTYPIDDVIPAFWAAVARGDKMFTYNGCKVDSWTLRGSAGGPVGLTLGLKALDEAVDVVGNFPSLTLPAEPPWMIFDGALTVGGSPYSFRDFELSGNNHLIETLNNSQTVLYLTAGDSTTHLRVSMSKDVGQALYGAGAAGLTVALAFNNGTKTLTINAPAWQFARRSPVVPGKDEIILNFEGECRKSGSTDSLSFTLTA